MPKAILEYNLPEEDEEFNLAKNGSKFLSQLEDIDHYLRSMIKYAPDSQPEIVTKTYQEVRDHLWRIRNDFE